MRKILYWLASHSIVRGPLRYKANGLFTMHNSDFMDDPDFIAAREVAKRTMAMDHPAPWRVYVNCWAVSHAAALHGCAVECGTWKGYTARAVVEYLRLKNKNQDGPKLKEYYLIDSFHGLNLEDMSEAERKMGLANKNKTMYADDIYSEVSHAFCEFPEVKVVRGYIPDVLKDLEGVTRVGYLHIDLNNVVPEIAAAEFFWPHLMPGAIVILDDYGFKKHFEQKKAFDAFAEARNASILTLPTGQGLILKA